MRSIATIVAATACFAGTSAFGQQYTMRIGLATINDAQHAFGQKYAEELTKRTKGAIKVDVFPASQLGKIPRQVENLKIGAQAVFLTPPGFLSGINRAFSVPDVPGVYKNYWHANNALTDPEFRDKFLAVAEQEGILGLSIANYGFTSIASVKPIRTLEDMKGMKLRVLATKMESKLAEVLGMTGVPMPYTEVLPALQQRTIDGCRAPIAVMAASKFFTVAKSVTAIETGIVSSVTFVSKPWLQKLPKDLQNHVIQTARDLEGWAAKNAFTYGQRAEKLWTDNGGEVIRLSKSDQATVMKLVAPLGDEFLGNDPATKELYGLLKKALARASTAQPK